MPKPSDESRRWIIDAFGSDACQPLVEFLQRRGWSLTRERYWKPPTAFGEIPDDEARVMLFLAERWNFGELAQVSTAELFNADS